MKHCKIIQCRVSVYRCGLCLGHYLAWLDTGAMPGETRPQPQKEDDVYIKRSELSQLRRTKDKEIAQLRAERDAANARIAELERLLGETQAVLAVAEQPCFCCDEGCQPGCKCYQEVTHGA